MGKVGILSHLEHRGPLAATDLAGLERISHQAVANAARELQNLGLVSRSPDPACGDGDEGASAVGGVRAAGDESEIL